MVKLNTWQAIVATVLVFAAPLVLIFTGHKQDIGFWVAGVATFAAAILRAWDRQDPPPPTNGAE